MQRRIRIGRRQQQQQLPQETTTATTTSTTDDKVVVVGVNSNHQKKRMNHIPFLQTPPVAPVDRSSRSEYEEPGVLSLKDMFIQSSDTLTGKHMSPDLHTTEGETSSCWNDRPPLLQGPRGQAESPNLLKGMVRYGVPPPLRCAVWLSNVMQTVYPHQSPKEWHEYRTLAKVRALDGAYDNLLQQILGTDNLNIHDATVWNEMEFRSYGQSVNTAQLIPDATEAGFLAQKRVLVALSQVVGMDYAPLLPTVVALLLCNMSESYAFTTAREMAHAAHWYFPCTKREHAAHQRAFCDIFIKLHAQTASYLDDRLVLDDLNVIFQNFFLGVLPLKYCLRIMDIYTLEGYKVLFRFGVALLVLYKRQASEDLVTISNASEWWDNLSQWTHSRKFDFDLVVRKAYGVHGRSMRTQMKFPNRQILRRIIKMEEERLLRKQQRRQDETGNYHPDDDDEDGDDGVRPLGLVNFTAERDYELAQSQSWGTREMAKPVLALQNSHRLLLAKWLPLTVRLTNLDLIYSTSYHGRSLEMLYNRVCKNKHTILLCEVLSKKKTESTGEGATTARPTTIIGMYANQAWRPSPQIYGDGECFLFRLEPQPACWKWRPRITSSTSINLLDGIDLTGDENSNSLDNYKETALLEQFMVGTRTYISMGGNPDGSSGLRLNEDLTVGESSPAVGFDNEPLHGLNASSVFDIGVLEVYGLVRQMDGRTV